MSKVVFRHYKKEKRISEKETENLRYFVGFMR